MKRPKIGVASCGNPKMLAAIPWENSYLCPCNTQTTVYVLARQTNPRSQTHVRYPAKHCCICVSLTWCELVPVAVNVEHGVGNTSARWLQWTDTRVKGQSRAATMDFNSGNVGQCSRLALPDCFTGVCGADVRAKKVQYKSCFNIKIPPDKHQTLKQW